MIISVILAILLISVIIIAYFREKRLKEEIKVKNTKIEGLKIRIIGERPLRRDRLELGNSKWKNQGYNVYGN